MSELQFGVYLPMAARGLGPAAFLAQLTEEVRAAERVGLDLVLLPEHHTGRPESLGDPTSLASWLLARTSTIRIGPGVLLLPLYHPAHIAEWCSFLQHASGNRLVLGVGTGYQKSDFDLFDVDHSSRVEDFDSMLARLRGAWRGTDGTRVIPHLPLADEPPIWIGAWSRSGLRRAGHEGDAWLVDPMRRDDEIAAMASVYREACAEAGRTPEIAIIRELWVDESDEEARARYLPVVGPVVEYYRRNGALRGATEPTDELIEQRVICGSVATVTDRIVELVSRTGATTIVSTVRHPGGPDHKNVCRAIERLGTEVLPAARRRLATTARRTA